MSPRLLCSLILLVFCSLAQAQDEQAPAPAEDVSADTTAESESDAADTMDTNTAPATAADAGEPVVNVASARYLCELQGLSRRVEIDYESADSSVPCSVNYYKDTEAPGEVNTLWTASNIEGYCEEKAAGFVDKLKSWGWSCTGD